MTMLLFLLLFLFIFLYLLLKPANIETILNDCNLFIEEEINDEILHHRFWQLLENKLKELKYSVKVPANRDKDIKKYITQNRFSNYNAYEGIQIDLNLLQIEYV